MVKDMTKGTPWKSIVLFALPLLFGNLFQQAYNLVDTMIVGRFAGPNALAGTGIASPVFNLITALMIGLSVGSSIMISQLFGAKETEKIKEAVSTVALTSLGFSAVLTVAGLLLAKPLLVLLQTPESDFSYAFTYLQIVIGGLVFNVFYNQLAGLLRGLGNSRTPLYVLIFSSFLNAGMDLFFVARLGMGVAGAALATVIAEGISALLLVLYILKKVPELNPLGCKEKWSRELFHIMIRFGLPMGFQQASISLGHVLMQGIVNPLGTSVIAAYTSAVKVDLIAVMPIISLGSAVSTFSAQNAGAGDFDRIRKGYRANNLVTVIVCLALTLIVVPNRRLFMSLFVSEADYPVLASEIISIGMQYLSILPCFYIVLGLIHSALNTMAGAGDTKFSMISMILMMALRVFAAWIFVGICSMDQRGIWIAFPVSWGLTLIFVLIHYFKGKWKEKALSRTRS